MPLLKKKCNLKQCLGRDSEGYCINNLPNMVKLLVFDSIKCYYYDDNYEKSLKDYMEHGGTLGALARLHGKEPKSVVDKDTPRPRKQRADKGKKRGPVPPGGAKRGRKKKEENSLQEIM